MNIKFTPLYLLAFLSLLFLVHETHDWAHFASARLICGCWGTKGFDSWTPCESCTLRPVSQALVLLAGPLVNYILLAFAWWLIQRRRTTEQQSLGFSLLFASIPLVRILAAFSGGGDETSTMRLIFQHTGGNRHLPALFGLALVLALTVPVLIRAFLMLGNWTARLFFFPLFLILPMFLDHWIVAGAMNELLKQGFLEAEGLPGMPILVLLWTFLWIFVLLSTYKSILRLLKPVK